MNSESRDVPRLTFATDDGAVILLAYDNGVIRDSADLPDGLRSGRENVIDDQYMRMAPQFDTGNERYSWLTRSLFIGEGRLAGDQRIAYTIHRLD